LRADAFDELNVSIELHHKVMLSVVRGTCVQAYALRAIVVQRVVAHPLVAVLRARR
jgi:hypothetical protein